MEQMYSFDQLRNLTIGTVDYVSPSEIRVLLEVDAPQNMALNTGVPSLFPRINGFVLIPNEIGAVVGIISWLGTEHSQYPKRKGFKDYDLIDLPFPTRKMSINPVGTLRSALINDNVEYILERGVYSFPSVGDSVILPKDEQLRAIVENRDKGAVVKIGLAPIAANAPVTINPNKLFGRHVAILGNTGSGKSCTTAGLIRWCLKGAEEGSSCAESKLNARFIVFDPNGEYTDCFKDIRVDLKVFKIELSEKEAESVCKLKVPAWLWNSYEWSSFSEASSKVQRPLLRRALKEIKNGAVGSESNSILQVRKFLEGCLTIIRNDKSIGLDAYSERTGRGAFGARLLNISDTLKEFQKRVDEDFAKVLVSSEAVLRQICESRFKSFEKQGDKISYYDSFTLKDVDQCIEAIEKALVETGGDSKISMNISEDIPIRFEPNKLVDHVEFLAENQAVLPYLDSLILRLRTMLSDPRINDTIKDDGTTLEDWLTTYITGISVIDLSLVPNDISHLIVAVISRMVFEATQRYRRVNNKLLPSVLLVEEAHNFIKRLPSQGDELSQTHVCNAVFERIAKEGRKFGLGLMISSQRPSELSDTVLSQCNTFFLHRIVNDRDQDLIKRLVPDNVGGLLKELPILPTRKCILMGWASPLPILVEINNLDDKYCPQSKDPDYWKVWTSEEIDEEQWTAVAVDWQKGFRGDAKVLANLPEDSDESVDPEN